jgi:integrase
LPRHTGKPRYVHLYRDCTGKQRAYFRKPGRPRVPLPLPLYSPAFWVAYEAAAQASDPVAETAAKPKVGQARPGTLSWLIEQFYKSAEWRSLRPSSKETYRRQYERFREEFGEGRLVNLTTRRVDQILGRMADRPAAANNLRDRLNVLMKFAKDLRLIEENPVDEAKRIKHKQKGFRTWTEEDVEAFRRRWPLGTPQRLAMEILLYTGLRRSDAVRLGRQHMTPDGKAFQITAVKTGVQLYIPIHPDLKDVLETALAGHLTYIVTAQGAPRSPKAFTGWLKEAAKLAGLPPDSSPHGLRKAACARLADCGATTLEIMSITGHQNLRELETYTRAANNKRLAEQAMGKWASTSPRTDREREVANDPDPLAKSGPEARGKPSSEAGAGGPRGTAVEHSLYYISITCNNISRTADSPKYPGGPARGPHSGLRSGPRAGRQYQHCGAPRPRHRRDDASSRPPLVPSRSGVGTGYEVALHLVRAQGSRVYGDQVVLPKPGTFPGALVAKREAVVAPIGRIT